MNPLLILDCGRSLRVRDGKLCLRDTTKMLDIEEWHMRMLPFDSMIVDNYGGFITFQAISFLASHGIPVYFRVVGSIPSSANTSTPAASTMNYCVMVLGPLKLFSIWKKGTLRVK